jgi:molybdate transport system substrate-binding protein
MRAIRLCLIFAFLLGAASSNISAGEEILVSAATSLKNAFEEIKTLFEKKTGIRVSYNFGASGLLQKQIEAGAPIDIFVSASEKQMDDLRAKGLIFSETKRNLAENSLVLITLNRPPLPLHSFSDLVDPGIERLAIGNPKTVPAGQYAEESLRYLKLWDRLHSRVILAENVRQVLDYVIRGEVQAGIVYASDVQTARGRVLVAAIAPEGSHTAILYPIAIVKGTSSRQNAQVFIDFALGGVGQAILQKYGFLRPR